VGFEKGVETPGMEEAGGIGRDLNTSTDLDILSDCCSFHWQRTKFSPLLILELLPELLQYVLFVPAQWRKQAPLDLPQQL